MNEKFIELSWFQVALSSTLIAATALLSVLLRLGLARSLLIGATRMVLQLILIGQVLHWVFGLKRWYAVVPLILVMSLIGSIAAVQQAGRRYPGIWLSSIISVMSSSWLMIVLGLSALVHVRPWYSPQYAVPLAGMIIGNALNGVALALNQFGEHAVTGRETIEGLLVLGASRTEAALLPMKKAVATGMLPTINMMMIAGIVSLPGTMTGQLLAGVDPFVALKYQIVIMFLLVAATALATVTAVWLSYRQIFSDDHQFLSWRITSPEGGLLTKIFSS